MDVCKNVFLPLKALDILKLGKEDGLEANRDASEPRNKFSIRSKEEKYVVSKQAKTN